MFVLLVAAPVGAQSDDPVELAEQATTDPAARAALRSLTPAADRALAGDDADVEERLETLAGQVPFDAATDPRVEAREILSQPRFATARPDTLGALIDEWQRRFTVWLNRLIANIIDNVPGGPRLFFGLLILGILAAAGVFASRLAQNRIRATEAQALARIRRERGSSPSELRARARDAAEAGDHAEAIRLLFLAGLTTLDERDRIEFTPGTTTGEISGSLHSPTFDRLAERFNDAVYGGRPAGASDFETSLAEWDTVLEGAS